ncbi:HXXEE domain-containing protein [Paenibacillus sp. FJAT-26967]|uniref:HXXEE domain-containing protein n=1 Tax=Paenibacillus sp. FJAT-26967 TaxID=1729690 RepID=UPI0020A599D7|nr:HXXEE domain-containing protein [Paenibacillus sp. FJAT-26967]
MDSLISVSSLMWLYLAAFIIHDLEEIIFVESWMNKHYPRIKGRIPSFAGPLLRGMSTVKSSQFAVAVLLEFVLFIPVTYWAVEHGNYVLFVGFNALMLLHVFTHAGQSVWVRSYTPGVVTAVIVTLPYGLYLFYRLTNEGVLTWGQILLYAPTGLLVLPVVLGGHKLGKMVIRD